MNHPYRRVPRLSMGLAALMATQALLGLLFHHTGYRDVAWIKATWWGNDAVTLVLVVPVFVVGMLQARKGSERGMLLCLGAIGYAIYNAMYYMFGAALNAFLPVYIVIMVLAVVALINLISQIDITKVSTSFRGKTPVKLIGGFFVFVGTSLALVWMGMWALHIFAGQPTPVEPEAFKIVAVIDCALIVPLLVIGGVMLWQRKPWGYVIAAMDGILGALYLVVLTVNSITGILLGLTEAPGEVPVWGTIGFFTLLATWVLLANVQEK